MVVVGSKCVDCGDNKGIEEALSFMGRIESERVVEDVEEGEISDSASVEEISEADFNRQEQEQEDSASGDSQSQRPKPESRVWTMRDLYNYPRFRTGLYNLAWAQAVQNKPLNDIFVMDVDPDDNARPPANAAAAGTVIDVSGDEAEKEEGELEEGEIDLEAGGGGEEEGASSCDAGNAGAFEIDSRNDGADSRVNSIRETLGSVNVIDADKSFGQVCSRIQNALESLSSESDFPNKDSISQMLFSALGVVNSVFSSMNLNHKEQERETLSRLLCSVKKCDPPLLSPEQMKETEIMIASLSPSTRASDNEKETQNTDQVHGMDSDFTAANTENSGHERSSVKWPSVASVVHSNIITPQEVVRPGTSAYKGRGILLPLLDLHKDHDEDSLPSPTRDLPPSFPVHKSLGVGDGIVKSGPATAKAATTEDSRLNRYETEAFKAVSTYQQKFGRSSFLTNDRLPSPTPSEEECDDGDDDTIKEVSSSFAGSNVRALSTTVLRPSVVSPSAHVNSSITQAPIIVKNAAPASASSNPTLKAPAKCRDPRLRFANSDSGVLDLNQRPLTAVHNAPKIEPSEPISSKKQRTGEEPSLDGPASKRQRNAFESAGIAGDVKSLSGGGGWLEDNGATGPQLSSKNQLTDNAGADPRRSVHMGNCPTTNGLNAGKEQVLASGAANALPELLKDIAVNPEILINILKGQQQRLAAEAQQKPDPVKDTSLLSTANSVLGAAPLVNITSSKALGILQTPAGSHPVTSQAGLMRTQDEAGKIRMKPRDPRRILHGNTPKKTGSLGNEQFKTTAVPMPCTMMNKDNLNGQKMHEGPADKKQMPSQPVMPPDIARQFTKNLRNIAEIVSVSNASTSPVSVSQNLPPQPVPVKSDRGEVKPFVPNAEDQRNATSSAEPTMAGASRAPNAWGDVEHLFEGYDDQQKAAIQRERARRLEEQKKMFEARKLCLVLDLDHTLLNSAKFVEVDPVHDDILRKKEEQDREKPQRHLFRFPHMGMWTKLRPGIWNFLEKASKLFELHLYTMGNKLYATEMAKVLDPKGTLFAGRVISRGDDEDPFDGDERVPKSKDLEGVLGMESAVVIIDDSVRVWPHNKLNLIVVERYTYFPCSRRQFGLPGPSLLEIDHDERPEEGTLASSLSVIERIHQNFFSHQSLDEADVRNILASEQQKILAGCRIVFSRVFPVSEVNPHLHPLWQTAEQFGAVCTTQIDDQVTHVVANSAGTDKVNWALSNGRFAVHPGWVEASALLYRRANEQDFAIKPSP